MKKQQKLSAFVDKAFTVEMIDLVLISGRVKPKTKNMVFTTSLLGFHIKRESV